MLIYLHGLNGSSRSSKAKRLRRRFAPLPVLVPSYPAHRPRAAVARLSGFFRDLDGAVAPLVIGSSMGGFYGQYLARRFAVAHLFMINPALRPWDLLQPYQGQSQTTAGGETYLIDRALLESTREYAIPHPCDGVPTTLFFGPGR